MISRINDHSLLFFLLKPFILEFINVKIETCPTFFLFKANDILQVGWEKEEILLMIKIPQFLFFLIKQGEKGIM